MGLMIERAIARIAHRGQFYNDEDFFTAHVERVVNNVQRDPDAMYLHVRAAYLHDVLEDTAWTADDLRDLGVSDMVIEVVQVLTRRLGERYMDYIQRVADNRDAALVKRADLRANSNEQTPQSLLKRNERALAVLDAVTLP